MPQTQDHRKQRTDLCTKGSTRIGHLRSAPNTQIVRQSSGTGAAHQRNGRRIHHGRSRDLNRIGLRPRYLTVAADGLVTRVRHNAAREVGCVSCVSRARAAPDLHADSEWRPAGAGLICFLPIFRNAALGLDMVLCLGVWRGVNPGNEGQRNLRAPPWKLCCLHPDQSPQCDLPASA